MNRGYTLLWRKVWANPLLCEPGRKFSRLEAWLYLTNVLAAGMEHISLHADPKFQDTYVDEMNFPRRDEPGDSGPSPHMGRALSSDWSQRGRPRKYRVSGEMSISS